jgi:hypothetical protein
VNAVLSHLKELLAGENHVTRLELARRPVVTGFKATPNAADDAEVCYIRLHVRGRRADVQGIERLTMAMNDLQDLLKIMQDKKVFLIAPHGGSLSEADGGLYQSILNQTQPREAPTGGEDDPRPSIACGAEIEGPLS